jgi:UDP-N-acetylglucosamine 4,6-dehydratase/5-epimerase
MFANKTIVITGGTGSFGNALLKRLLLGDFREVRIFSRDELKQELMRVSLGDSRVKFHIGDVRDRHSVDSVMQGANFVFHAAALKQVPSCEFFPMQAVLTNVIGSANVIESAVANGVRKVVCLGTDKAVYPVNTMGMTKALMEKIAQSTARRLGANDTVVCSVRYGNVMCSRGSVIPLFVEQILAGNPITVTVPGMTRFLLSLHDAIELVLFAFQHGQQGEILIRKAPACTIGDLGEALQRLMGRQTGTRVIGMRHGEKLFETLANKEELRRSTDMGDYFRVVMDDRELDYAKYVTEGDRAESSIEEYNSDNTQRLGMEEVAALLRTLPEIQLPKDVES